MPKVRNSVLEKCLFPCQKALLKSEKISNRIEEENSILENEHRYYCTIQDLNITMITHGELEEVVDTDYYIENKIKNLLTCCDNNCKYLKDSF